MGDIKHYAFNDQETGRDILSANIDKKAARESDLLAFQIAIGIADPSGVMCAYNRVNGEPCCTSNTLLRQILKSEWKFKGHIVTDCWALEDIWRRHEVMEDAAHVAAAAVKAGINMDCSNLLQDDLQKALQLGLITAEDINNALRPALRTQFKLGFFDDPKLVPFSNLGEESIHNKDHVRLARIAAQQSMVMLKNKNNLLPFTGNKYSSIMVIGPNSTNADALLGNYHGVSPEMVTFVEGITEAAGPATGVQYDLGCTDVDSVHFGGIWAAGNSDAIIAVVGLTPVSEGEEGDAFMAPHGGDRTDLSIPKSHIAFLKALRKTNKPTVVVVTSGSDVDIAAIEPYADAIILAWYPGEQGGNALADIVFGKVSPSGKLPITFYKSLNDLPPYDSYAVKGRTYRYFKGDVQFPFGFGLSFSSFAYAWEKQPLKSYHINDSISVTISIKNTGAMEADEVAQLYVQYPDGERMPLQEMKQFKRVSLDQGETKIIRFTLPVSELAKWDLDKKQWNVVRGQ